MDHKFQLLSAALGAERVKQNQQLKYYLYTKQDKVARFFYIATTISELLKVLNTCDQLGVPFFIVGSGTKAFFPEDTFIGIVIKNQTSGIKISGIKGKVGVSGIGVEEAMVEVESGVSLQVINEFLAEQKLTSLVAINPPSSTIGGAIFVDPHIQNMVASIKIWDRGETETISPPQLNIEHQIVLSVILKTKAKI